MFITVVCKRSYQEQPTTLEVVQGQIRCSVSLRASQKAEQQIMGQIVDIKIKKGRKLCSEGCEMEASLGREHIKSEVPEITGKSSSRMGMEMRSQVKLNSQRGYQHGK